MARLRISVHTQRILAALVITATVVGALRAQVPAPKDIFGFTPGTDYKLADYGMITDYFRALAASSDRVVLEEIGVSSLGKPMFLALISSPDNLSRRARFKSISQQLAQVNDLDESGARALAREGRAIVWVDGGLHATEVAHGQFTPEFAYWLATDEGDEARRVRDNVIVLLMPNMNPDGLDIVAHWYARNVGTEFETSPVPELYHHYIGHDNNRDWYMFTQVETQAVAKQLYHEWFPQIVYNHHQSGPFPARIWVPPFENPVNPNLDPLIVTSINQIGESMKKRFDEENKPGAVSGVLYDMWWNGSMRGAPDFHNMLGFLTETALYRYATPHCYGPDEIPDQFSERAGSLPTRDPTTGYPNPWLGGCWTLRDPIEYMMTATRTVVDLAARYRKEYLFNIYRMGARQIERGRHGEGGPFAYVIDLGAQHDPGAAVEMLRVFREGGIEIRRASRPFTADGQEYPAGTYVIPPQAFRPFVVDLMEPKRYPDRRLYPGGPPEPPYDMTGYELRLQMGVTAVNVNRPFALPETIVAEIPTPSGGVRGTGAWGYLLSPRYNATTRALSRVLETGGDVRRAMSSFQEGGMTWPAGTAIIRGTDVRLLDDLGVEIGVEFQAISAAPSVATAAQRRPRIGIYEGHVGNMPTGWTRWLLDQYRIPFELVHDQTIRSGDLSTFDVIVLASQSARSIRDGNRPGTVPPEYTGGLGEEGMQALRRFVMRGGWLVVTDNSVDYAIDAFALPIENVSADLSTSEFFIPGSLINIDVDPNDPVGFGMPSSAIAFFVRSQVLKLAPGAGTERDDIEVFARYASDDFLASGWAHGAAEYLAGGVAGARVRVGEGQIVLLAFEPHFRGQPHNTFKLLFNALWAAAAARDAHP